MASFAPTNHCCSSSAYISSPLGFFQRRQNLFSVVSGRRLGSENGSLHSKCSLHHVSAVKAPPSKESSPEKLKRESFPVTSPMEQFESTDPCVDGGSSHLSITSVGASGDLAKKIFPALFALYYEGCLPENFTIFGYARSKMTEEEMRVVVSETLTCRIDKRENCDEKMDQFLTK